MTQEELLERIRKAVSEGPIEAARPAELGAQVIAWAEQQDPATWTVQAQAQALQDGPESLAAQARLMMEETRRRAFAEGMAAGRLQLMSEMVTHPNQN